MTYGQAPGEVGGDKYRCLGLLQVTLTLSRWGGGLLGSGEPHTHHNILSLSLVSTFASQQK